MTLGIEREGLAEPLRELAAAGTPMLGTCAGMIMLDRDHLGLLDIRARAQRVRPPAALVRGRPRGRRRRRRPGARGVHPRAVGRRGGAEVEVLAEVDGHPVAVRQGNIARGLVPPRADRRDAAARAAARAERDRPRRRPADGRVRVGAELALERRPVEPRHAVGLRRRLLVDRLLAVARRILLRRVPRDSQTASAQTPIPAA